MSNFQGLTQHQFLTDEALFGSINPRDRSWRAWNCVFKGSDGERLTKSEAEIWRKITGRKPPRKGFSPEIEVDIIGRRGGKTLTTARRAIKQAFTGDHQQCLAPGEKAFVLIVSVNVRSARVIFDYIKGFLEGSPLLWSEVAHMTKHEIHLKNNVVIAVYPCSHVSIRGLAIYVLILEEASFFRSEGMITDLEIFRAARPAMAQFLNAKVYIITSPYSKSGLVYDLFRDHFGDDKSKDVLVIKAPSEVMNPTLSRKFLKKERIRDPEAYHREFDAEFSEGIADFLALDAIEGSVDWGVYKREYNSSNKYTAGADANAGGGEYFSYSITHRTKEGYELDMIDGWNRTKPETCVDRICAVLKEYKITTITGDKFSGSWVKDSFERRGITYRQAKKTKSEYFAELGPEILQGTVRLLEHKQLLKELRMLERRTSPQGKDVITHPPRGTDDFANSLAISVFHSKKKKLDPKNYLGLFSNMPKKVPAHGNISSDVGARGGSTGGTVDHSGGRPEPVIPGEGWLSQWRTKN